MLLLVGSVEVGHSFAALVEEDECATEAVVGKGTDVLVHASLCSGQEPEDTLDDKVGYEPAETAGGDGAVHIGCFEEVGDQAVDGKTAFELLAEDLEAGESFGEGEEAVAEAHGY